MLVVAPRAVQVQAPAARGAAPQQGLRIQLQRQRLVAVRLRLLKAQHLPCQTTSKMYQRLGNKARSDM